MPTESRRRGRLYLAGAVLVIAAGATFAAIAFGGSGKASSSGTVPGQSTTTTAAPSSAAVTVLSVSPAAGRTGVARSATIDLDFSSPLSANSPDPILSPKIAGSWTRPSSTELSFVPSSELAPDEAITVTVPAGANGVVSTGGGELVTTYKSTFTTVAPSILRLEQLLGELDYLPVAFVPTGSDPPATASGVASTTELDAEASSADAISLDAAPGHFVWRFPNVPTQLAAGWQSGDWGVVARGALMAFESNSGLAIDGEVGPAVWEKLLMAVAARTVDPHPYDYLIVTETVPETLYVWRDGSIILQTPANTGVSGAATALGTFPVYLKFTSTTMSGTNPDGTHYSDPGVPWVSYFNASDAVHGFIRPGYGVPQSDGCVELPISTAEEVFPLDPYGTLVTVTDGVLTAELHSATPFVTGEFAESPTSTTTPPKEPHPPTTTTIPPRKPHPTTTTTTTTTSTTTTTTTTPPPPTTVP